MAQSLTVTPRAASCSSTDICYKQTRSPTELLQAETCPSCCSHAAHRSSFSRTFQAGREEMPFGPRTAPSPLPGEEGAGDSPKPAFCFNKHFPPPMRKPAAAQRRGRVGFPSHCLPGSALPPAALTVLLSQPVFCSVWKLKATADP